MIINWIPFPTMSEQARERENFIWDHTFRSWRSANTFIFYFSFSSVKCPRSIVYIVMKSIDWSKKRKKKRRRGKCWRMKMSLIERSFIHWRMNDVSSEHRSEKDFDQRSMKRRISIIKLISIFSRNFSLSDRFNQSLWSRTFSSPYSISMRLWSVFVSSWLEKRFSQEIK